MWVMIVAECLSSLTIRKLANISYACDGCGYAIDPYCCLLQLRLWIRSILAKGVAGLFGPRLSLAATLRRFRFRTIRDG